MAPVDPAAQTPQRILAAAVEEFATYGLAGARVDRVAEAAGANKQRIYAYFGSKDQLFDAVMESKVGDLLDAVPFDAVDLPGYAVRLFEFQRAHPELVRLLMWHVLERPGVLTTLEENVESTQNKLRLLAEHQAAQPDALLALPPELLLGRVLSLVHGVSMLAYVGPTDGRVADDLHDAVARLVGAH